MGAGPTRTYPSELVLKMFAVSWAIMLGVLAWFLGRQTNSFLSDLWPLPLGLAILLAGGLLKPGTLRPLYGMVERGLQPVGKLFSMLMFAAVYYSVITCFAFFLRASGRVLLCTRWPNPDSTAWRKRSPHSAASSYFWQS